eukprot:Nitzschia sp. Nitz4//scaffold3_size479765//473661//475094//NITZ4_000198-RA/size479765-processed-gene-1.281-mRNA-1//1//CDS//3329551052//70//frame0
MGTTDFEHTEHTEMEHSPSKDTPALGKPIVRAITVFVNFQAKDFLVTWGNLFSDETAESKLEACASLLRDVERDLKSEGYTVQSLRIATNPFGEWMLLSKEDYEQETNHAVLDDEEDSWNKFDMLGNRKKKRARPDKLTRLDRVDQHLQLHQIEFCSVGPATNEEEARLCPDIVARSHRISCSSVVEAGDVASADCAADVILAISKLGERPHAAAHVKGGVGNFRFCAASSCKHGIPFFPVAKGEPGLVVDGYTRPPPLQFAIGLENGSLARELLGSCKTVDNIRKEFGDAYSEVLKPLQKTCQKIARAQKVNFLGIDSSLNPSLDESGSVAAALEQLQEVKVFGGAGTVGAAAEITKSLQSLPGIQLTGYCGLMLPLCEDARLAQLAALEADPSKFRISDLLSISSVCGVGVDTVPVPGDCTKQELSALILDVAGIAGRWNKSLSCRVFPVPGKTAGQMTDFDSPFMVNSKVLSLK